MSKTLSEILQIARERRAESLEGLSATDLNVLLATLNRKKVPMSEQEAFSRFYLLATALIRNNQTRES